MREIFRSQIRRYHFLRKLGSTTVKNALPVSHIVAVSHPAKELMFNSCRNEAKTTVQIRIKLAAQCAAS